MFSNLRVVSQVCDEVPLFHEISCGLYPELHIRGIVTQSLSGKVHQFAVKLTKNARCGDVAGLHPMCLVTGTRIRIARLTHTPFDRALKSGM